MTEDEIMEKARREFPHLPDKEARVQVILAHNRRASQPAGFGDTVEKLAHAVGADRLAAAYTRLTGRDCGCNARRETLNRLFPYEKT